MAELPRILNLTDFEKAPYPKEPNVPRYTKIVRFATISTVKAGWLIKNKGRWTLTREGKAAFEDFTDPEKFNDEARRLYKEWKSTQPEYLDDADDPQGLESAAALTTATYEEADELAWSQIDQHLRSMPPYDVQRVVAALLRAMGYHVSWLAPPGKDGGVDIIAGNDPLGTKPPRIKVQVKRQVQKVDVETLRSFLSLLGHDDVGLYVSIGGFTKDAEDLARAQETRRITLLDADRFFDLWIDHYAKVREAEQNLLPLKPIWYLAPVE